MAQKIFISVTVLYRGKVGQVRWQELLTAQGQKGTCNVIILAGTDAIMQGLPHVSAIWIIWLSTPCNVKILAGTDTIMYRGKVDQVRWQELLTAQGRKGTTIAVETQIHVPGGG